MIDFLKLSLSYVDNRVKLIACLCLVEKGMADFESFQHRCWKQQLCKIYLPVTFYYYGV